MCDPSRKATSRLRASCQSQHHECGKGAAFHVRRTWNSRNLSGTLRFFLVEPCLSRRPIATGLRRGGWRRFTRGLRNRNKRSKHFCSFDGKPGIWETKATRGWSFHVFGSRPPSLPNKNLSVLLQRCTAGGLHVDFLSTLELSRP